jgi:murein L,D-transpeptidase YcbB/YkuD
MLKLEEDSTERRRMDPSSVSMSANGNGLVGQIQVSLLKTSQDQQAGQVAQLLQSAQVSPANLGKAVDVTA